MPEGAQIKTFLTFHDKNISINDNSAPYLRSHIPVTLFCLPYPAPYNLDTPFRSLTGFAGQPAPQYRHSTLFALGDLCVYFVFDSLAYTVMMC